MAERMSEDTVRLLHSYTPPTAKRTRRADTLMREYGISESDYDAMLADQKGRCAICGEPPTDKWGVLCVDHNHETGEVRALLCRNCNRDLAVVENTVKRDKLIAYLEKTNGK